MARPAAASETVMDECKIQVETAYNPWDRQGLDCVCLTHNHHFNVPTKHGDTNPKRPEFCPLAKDKLH